jgi:SAM-dependent methyltransferase
MIPHKTQIEERRAVRALIGDRCYEEARARLEAFLLRQPDDAEGFRLLAEVQGALGRRGHQEVALKRASQLEQIALNNKVPAAADRYAALLARKRRPESVLEVGGHVFGPLRAVEPRRHVLREAGSTCGNYLLRVYSPEAGERDAVERETGFLKRLTGADCQSAPRLVEAGQMDSGEPFVMLLYPRADRGGFGLPDLLLALLEQQALGVFPGRLGLPYLRYDSLAGLCRFMDYSLAEELDAETQALSAGAYLDWCFEREAARCRREGERPFVSPRSRTPDWIWQGERLNLMATQAFRSQRLADVPEPSVQSLDLERAVLAGSRDWAAQAAALEEVDFLPGERVLDLGCGLGAGCQFLARRGCAVTGIDVEERVLQDARLAANLGGLGGIRFVRLDLDYADCPDFFDTILALATLPHFLYPDRAFARLNRICRRRLILECGLKEAGFKWHGRWYGRIRGWEFDSEKDLKERLEEWFPAFRVRDEGLATERGRRLYVLERTET